MPKKTSELLQKMERKIECVLDITHSLVTVEQLKALDRAIEHYKAGIPEGSECKTEGFVIAVNKAETTWEELQWLIAEAKRLTDKAADNMRRANELLGNNYNDF